MTRTYRYRWLTIAASLAFGSGHHAGCSDPEGEEYYPPCLEGSCAPGDYCDPRIGCIPYDSDLDVDTDTDTGTDTLTGCEHDTDPDTGTDDSVSCIENSQGYQECERLDGRGGPFIVIPAATFWMGCRDELNGSSYSCLFETPQHEVQLSTYAIDKYEITQSQYKAFADSTGACYPVVCDSGNAGWHPDARPDHPAVCLGWKDTRAYCKWLGGDLLTEAQWEYAARGPMSGPDDYTIFPWGTNYIDCRRANYGDCSGQNDQVGSHPSGASPFGVMDMAGNVWEPCLDWYSDDYYQRFESSAAVDPQGPESGTGHVKRSGSWSPYAAHTMRSASRSTCHSGRTDHFGGRCARPIPR